MVSEGNISSASDSILPSNPSEDQEVKQVPEKMGLSMKQHGSTDIHMILSGESEKNVSSVLDVSIQPLNRKDLFGNHHLSNVMEPSSTSEMLEVHPDDTAGSKTMVQSSNSTRVLEKLFGSTLTLDASGSSMVLEVMIYSFVFNSPLFELGFQFLFFYFDFFSWSQYSPLCFNMIIILG